MFDIYYSQTETALPSKLKAYVYLRTLLDAYFFYILHSIFCDDRGLRYFNYLSGSKVLCLFVKQWCTFSQFLENLKFRTIKLYARFSSYLYLQTSCIDVSYLVLMMNTLALSDFCWKISVCVLYLMHIPSYLHKYCDNYGTLMLFLILGHLQWSLSVLHDSQFITDKQ
jgi:hypothetical protein